MVYSIMTRRLLLGGLLKKIRFCFTIFGGFSISPKEEGADENKEKREVSEVSRTYRRACLSARARAL